MTEASSRDGEANGKVLLRVRNVSFKVGSRTILDDISLEVKEGELVSIVGPNGGGKTTLLKILIGSNKPTDGEVWRDKDLTVGYQPQRTRVAPSMPLSVRALLRLTAFDGSDENLGAAIEELKLGKKLLEAQVTSLSGGERQLVMVARAMLCRPRLLALDEPGTYCDPQRLSELYSTIERFVEQNGCTTIMVSHDISRVLSHSDHVHCIDRRLLCEGGPEHVARDAEFEEIFGQPAHTGIYKHRH